MALLTLSTNAIAKKVKIGFVLSTTQEERYQKDEKYFKAKAKELGARVIFASCDNSERIQATKVENILAKGIKALVIQPVNSNAAAPMVAAAKKAGVPVISYDRIINNANLDYHVTQDSYEVGRLQAQAAIKHLKGSGNVVILSGQAGHSVATEITRGATDELKKHPKINIVTQKWHNSWSSSEAMSTVENVLTKYKNEIHAILANNSGMANGAVQALDQQGLARKIFVGGADADLAAVRNIVSGKQHFEVLKALKPLAEKSAWLAVELANGRFPSTKSVSDNGTKKVPTFNTPVFPVNSQNIEQQIIAYGFHSKKDVYGK